MVNDQDPVDGDHAAYVREVKRSIVIARSQWIYRRSALNRASRAWWARALLHGRREKK